MPIHPCVAMLKMLSLTFVSSFDEVDCSCRGKSRHGRHVADVASRRPHEATDRRGPLVRLYKLHMRPNMHLSGRGAMGGRTQLTGSRFRTAKRARSTLARWPDSAESGHSSATVCHFESNMNRLTSKAVFHFAVVLILLGALMVLVMLTSPSAITWRRPPSSLAS